VLTYNYTSGTGWTGIDNRISRLSSLSDTAGTEESWRLVTLYASSLSIIACANICPQPFLKKRIAIHLSKLSLFSSTPRQSRPARALSAGAPRQRAAGIGDK
jgi:hypothetical protein